MAFSFKYFVQKRNSNESRLYFMRIQFDDSEESIYIQMYRPRHNFEQHLNTYKFVINDGVK